MKHLFSALVVLFILGGCASHPDIKFKMFQPISSDAFNNKTFKYEVFYSQPEPGIFLISREQQAFAPLEQANVSLAATKTLTNLPNIINQQLPHSVVLTQSNPEYLLKIFIKAHDVAGPAFADFEGVKSLVKHMFTLGLGSDEFNIVADYDIRYELYNNNKKILSKEYKINESLDDERSMSDSFDNPSRYAVQIFDEHMIETTHNFFVNANEILLGKKIG